MFRYAQHDRDITHYLLSLIYIIKKVIIIKVFLTTELCGR